MNNKTAILILATLLLAACGSAPHRTTASHGTSAATENKAAYAPNGGGYLAGDGPGANAPANLDAIPDAVPKNEPYNRYANRPYVALGKTYTPLTVAGNFKERGIASWYGKKFNGERTSSGETYDMYAMTAAHPTLPLPSYARVTNVANQKSIIVRINDRGPFMHDRVIDLSYAAAYKLGIVGDGSMEVEVESLAANARITPVIAKEPVPIKPQENSDSEVYLQLGAFKSQEGAESFMAKMRIELGDTGKQIKLSTKDGLVHVHIGPYANQSEARSCAESLEGKLGFKPMVNLQ